MKGIKIFLKKKKKKKKQQYGCECYENLLENEKYQLVEYRKKYKKRKKCFTIIARKYLDLQNFAFL